MFGAKASERSGLISSDITEKDYWPSFHIDLLCEGLDMTIANEEV